MMLLAAATGRAEADERTWLLVKYEALAGAQMQLFTPQATTQLLADWETGLAKPIRILWVTPDGVREEVVAGVGADGDDGYVIADTVRFDVDVREGSGAGMIVSSIAHADVRVTDAGGKTIGRFADLGAWPQALGRGRFFDSPRHRILSLDPEQADIPMPDWIEYLQPVSLTDDVFRFGTGPFRGLIRADGTLLTGASWLVLRDFGNGTMWAIDPAKRQSVLNTDGLPVLLVPDSSLVDWIGQDQYCFTMLDRTAIVGADAVNARDYPVRYTTQRIQSNPGLVVFSELTDSPTRQRQTRFWDTSTKDFAGEPQGAAVHAADDQSPVLTFEDDEGAGMFSDRGELLFRLRHFGPRPFDLTPGQSRGEWSNPGPAYKGAALFRLEVKTVSVEQETEHRTDHFHWYLLDPSGNLIWKSEGAPDPIVERAD